MTISDKSRKILWGRSGNRCALCKHELIVDPTPKDDDSVIGEECHIVSGEPNGPRYDATFPRGKLNSYPNLILLCRTHHKMVDDQTETFTAEILRQTKVAHEKWVTEKLSLPTQTKPVRIRRVTENIPAVFGRLTSGKDVLDLVIGCSALWTDHDEVQTPQEADLVGDFLQTLRDVGDIGSDLEPIDRVRFGFELTHDLGQLENTGFYAFGAREVQRIEGGLGEPAPWTVAHIYVLRKTNPLVVAVSIKSGSDNSSQSIDKLADEDK